MRKPFLIIFLLAVVFLHCSQLCTVANGGSAGVAIVHVSAESEGANSCHSPVSVPDKAPARCLDCSSHVFLTSAPHGGVCTSANSFRAFLVVLPPFLVSALPTLSSAVALRHPTTIFALPSYLTFAVLRL